MDNPEVVQEEAQYDMSRVPALLHDWAYYSALDIVALRRDILAGNVQLPDIPVNSVEESIDGLANYRLDRLIDIRLQLLKCYFPSCRTSLPRYIEDIPELSDICALPDGKKLLKYSFESLLVESDPAILKQALETGGTTMEELMRSQIEKELFAWVDDTFIPAMGDITLNYLSTNTFPDFEFDHSLLPRAVYSKPELFEPTMAAMAGVLAQHKTVTISGLPGSGKSELLYNFIKKYRSVFYEGILINSQQDFITGIKRIMSRKNNISVLQSFELLPPEAQIRVANHLVERLGPALLLMADDEMIGLPKLPQGSMPSVIKTVPQAEGEASADNGQTFEPPVIHSSKDFPEDWTIDFDEATIAALDRIIELVHGHPGIVHSCFQFLDSYADTVPKAVTNLEEDLKDPKTNRDRIIARLSDPRLHRHVSPEEFDSVMLDSTLSQGEPFPAP